MERISKKKGEKALEYPNNPIDLLKQKEKKITPAIAKG